MATPLTNYINYFVNIFGENKLGRLGKLITNLQTSFVKFGVTTIFVDRLLQSFTRAWGALNNALGVVRLGETGEQVLRMAEFMDIGTTKLQAFNSAIGTLGRDMDFTRDLLQTFNERVSDISSVQGIADDFARIGLSARDFADSEDAIDRFMVFADKLQKVSAKDRMTAVEAILGGDLSVVGQLGGMEEILRLMDEAVEKGHIFSEQQLTLAADFQRAFRSVGRTITSMSNNLGSTLMPVLLRIASLIDNITGKISKYINEYNVEIANTVSDAFDKPLSKLEYFFDWWDTNVKGIGETVVRLLGPLAIIAAIAAVVFGGGPAFAAMSIAAAVLFLAAAIDDLFTFMRGGDSVLGDIVQYFSDLEGSGTFIGELFKLLKASYNDLVTAIKTSPIFKELLATFGVAGGGGGGIIGALQAIVGILGTTLMRAALGVFKIFEGLASVLMGIVSAVKFIMAGGGFLSKDSALGGMQDRYLDDFTRQMGGGLSSGILGTAEAVVGSNANPMFNTSTVFNISTTDPAAATTAAGETDMRMQRAMIGKI